MRAIQDIPMWSKQYIYDKQGLAGIKTWLHPLSQSEPSILMLYIPLTVLIHQVIVDSCADH